MERVPKLSPPVRMCGLAVVAVLAGLPFMAAPARADLVITVTGSLPDLDGDGSNADEAVVLDAAIGLWSSGILTNRTFNLTLQTVDFANGPFASGRLDTFDSQQIPTGGTVFIDNNLANNFPGSPLSFLWFVDDTPLDHSEFVPDSDFGNNHRHFIGGPGAGRPDERHIDLLTILTHELGHALGWSADPVNRPGFNPRFVALMDPQPVDFQAGTRVFLRSGTFSVPLAGDGLGSPGDSANELSHLASRGEVPGWQETLMSRVFNFTERYLPGDVDYLLFQHAYGDEVAVGDAAVVPEPGSVTLGLIGAFALLAWRCRWRKRGSEGMPGTD